MIEFPLPSREHIVITPEYQRVVDDIVAQIQSGALRPGQELPSYRELAIQYDVSISTVNRAVMVLKTLGLADGHQGKGVYVTSPDPDA